MFRNSIFNPEDKLSELRKLNEEDVIEDTKIEIKKNTEIKSMENITIKHKKHSS
jgi:hypothetical protein